MSLHRFILGFKVLKRRPSRENDASPTVITSLSRARWRPPSGCCSADRPPSPALISKSLPQQEYRGDRVSIRDGSAAGVSTMLPQTEAHISVSRRFRKRRRRRKVSRQLAPNCFTPANIMIIRINIFLLCWFQSCESGWQQISTWQYLKDISVIARVFMAGISFGVRGLSTEMDSVLSFLFICKKPLWSLKQWYFYFFPLSFCVSRSVYKVFENVARKYDVMNDFMSFGIHRLWKDALLHVMHPQPGSLLLDVAGGTGRCTCWVQLLWLLLLLLLLLILLSSRTS